MKLPFKSRKVNKLEPHVINKDIAHMPIKTLTITILLTALTVVLVLAVIVFWQNQNTKQATTESLVSLPRSNASLVELQLANHKLQVEIAETRSQIEKGLGDRDQIGSDGMLFVLPAKMVPTFWMQGMRFDLDFVWIYCGEGNIINEDCEVTQVDEHIKAPGNNRGKMEYITSTMFVTHVLELQSGRVGALKVQVGDQVQLIQD